MTEYLKKSFSVHVGGDQDYRDKWEEIFGKKTIGDNNAHTSDCKCDKCDDLIHEMGCICSKCIEVEMLRE